MYSFRVNGIPRPQGSKRHVGNGRLIEMSKGLPAWRKAIVEAIDNQIQQRPWVQLDVAVKLSVTFYVPRPASARNRAFPYLNGPGDLDKLIRAVADAITKSGLWKDDSQMCEIVARKLYADSEPGAYVVLDPM